MRPLLSIIIATKNRTAYCLGAIESILKIPSPQIELIIQDNSEKNDLELLVKTYDKDRRLRYRYTPPPLSSIANFNLGLEVASGKYVCMIGDDDSVNTNIVEIVEWADRNGVDSVTGSIPVNYRWPGIEKDSHKKADGDGGLIRIEGFNCKVRRIDPLKSLEKLIRNGCTNYLLYDFPKFYHGIVKKNLFVKMKSVNGYFIGGLSPDIYTSVGLCFYVRHAVVIDYPITIPGVCNQSTSITEGENKAQVLDIYSAPHFRDRGEYVFDQRIPPLYCPQTIWADSAIRAITELGDEKLLSNLNLNSLYFQIICLKNDISSAVFDYIKLKYRSKKIFVYLIMMARIPIERKTWHFIGLVFGKVSKIVKISIVEEHQNVDDILRGRDILTKYIIKGKKNVLLNESLVKYSKKVAKA